MDEDKYELGKRIYQLYMLIMEIMKEHEPEEYERIMALNEKAKQERLVRELKANNNNK